MNTISDDDFKIADGVITLKAGRQLQLKQQHAGYSGLAPSDGS